MKSGRPPRRSAESGLDELDPLPAERQGDRECRGLPEDTLDHDRAAVLLDDMEGAGQPNPGAARLGQRIRAAVVGLEDAAHLVGRNPDALVTHRQDGPVLAVALLAGGADHDGAALGAVLD